MSSTISFERILQWGEMQIANQDEWAKWLLKSRFGEEADCGETEKATLKFLTPIRERILDNAQVSEGETLLDVGSGDGFIAFGALERVGAKGRVILSDVSQDLLNHSRARAQDLEVVDQCEFIRAPAEDLSVLEDLSIDVITIRSVLIFVESKKRAFDEFYRILRPGGRVSLFEPIHRFVQPEPANQFWGYDVGPILEIANKVRKVFNQLQPPDGDPMLDFDERDLFKLAEMAGFDEIHLELNAEVKSKPLMKNWGSFIHVKGNPKIPTLNEALQQALTAAERERFIAHLRPLVEKGRGINRIAFAYVWAVK